MEYKFSMRSLAQDLSSPDEEDEPPLSNSRGFIDKFSNFEAIF